MERGACLDLCALPERPEPACSEDHFHIAALPCHALAGKRSPAQGKEYVAATGPAASTMPGGNLSRCTFGKGGLGRSELSSDDVQRRNRSRNPRLGVRLY